MVLPGIRLHRGSLDSQAQIYPSLLPYIYRIETVLLPLFQSLGLQSALLSGRQWRTIAATYLALRPHCPHNGQSNQPLSKSPRCRFLQRRCLLESRSKSGKRTIKNTRLARGTPILLRQESGRLLSAQLLSAPLRVPWVEQKSMLPFWEQHIPVIK